MPSELVKVNENWIYQGNRLVEASYSLTVLEQKLVRLLASMIKKDDTEFSIYEFKAKELSEILGINTKNIYKELDNVTDKLMTRFIKIKDDENKAFKKRHVIEVADFENGILTLKIHKDMKAFYLNLSQYTKYQLKNVMQFKSTYSFRVYELLKQYQKIGYRTIEVDKLRLMLDIGKDEYPKYANLKQKVIKTTIKEINEKTDLTVDYEEIKTVRKVTSIKFTIRCKCEEVAATVDDESKSKTDIHKETRENLNEPIKQIIEMMKRMNITPLEATTIYNQFNGDINRIRECYEYAMTQNITTSFIGYMDTLSKGFIKPKKYKATDNFNNYEQRKYDFDELEAKLLGWDK